MTMKNMLKDTSHTLNVSRYGAISDSKLGAIIINNNCNKYKLIIFSSGNSERRIGQDKTITTEHLGAHTVNHVNILFMIENWWGIRKDSLLSLGWA